MFGIGVPELIFLLALALVILGPDKLPAIARILGKGVYVIRRASEEFRTGFEKEIDPIQKGLKVQEGFDEGERDRR